MNENQNQKNELLPHIALWFNSLITIFFPVAKFYFYYKENP